MNWKVKLDINEKYEDKQVMIRAPRSTTDIALLTRFIQQLSDVLVLKKEDKQVELPVQNIVYLEHVERTTFIYTESDMYEDQRPLYEFGESLAEFDFIRINKQTIVNPRYTKSVKALLNSKYELVMTSGEKLIVTRHYRSAFKALFTKGGLFDA